MTTNVEVLLSKFCSPVKIFPTECRTIRIISFHLVHQNSIQIDHLHLQMILLVLRCTISTIIFSSIISGMQVIYYIQMDPFHNCIFASFYLTTFPNILFSHKHYDCLSYIPIGIFCRSPNIGCTNSTKSKTTEYDGYNAKFVKPSMDNTEVEIFYGYFLSIHSQQKRNVFDGLSLSNLWQLKRIKGC